MCGGGDGPEPPDPMEQAEAQIKQMQAQYDFDQKAQVAAAQRSAEQEAAGREQWSTDLGAARTGASGAAQNAFKTAGLDPNDYMKQINAALDLEQSGKSYGQPTGFSTDLGTNLLSDIRNKTIKGYQGGIEKFAPAGFEEQAFGSTADDAIIDAILNEQFGTASDSIMRAKSRGTLNDAGYKYAMDNLNTQRAAGSSRLQDMGGGILEGYRGQLGDIAGNARTAAGGWDFGQTFDPSTYQTQLTDKQTDLSGGMEGAIRAALGGEELFNTADLIAKGGVGQGAINTGLGASGGLYKAIGKRNQEEEKPRGLGTQGSF